MDTQELIHYYTELLIEQYRPMPKARATVEALVGEVIADQIYNSVLNAYNIDTAVGAQLDVIGKYVGVSRYVKGLDFDREYFAMPSYEDPDPTSYAGFYAYSDTPIVNYWALYADFVSAYQMTDDEMRRFIKYQIRLNKSDMSLQEIDEIMYEYFGADCEVTDGTDMTVTYAFDPAATDKFIKIVAFVGALPRPAGVKIIITGV